MPSKKPTPAKKAARGKRPSGLTSALGPKRTAIVVICVIAGGILVAARQQARPKNVAPTIASSTTEPAPVSSTIVDKGSAPNAAVRGSNPAGAASGAVVKTSFVTVTGCLARTDGGFRLKDTGADAPRSRSWKSGFLKKGTAPVDLVDATHSLDLAGALGHRVSVTGTLVDREMRARSMRQIAASCN